jgi:hypothetical protein
MTDQTRDVEVIEKRTDFQDYYQVDAYRLRQMA